MIFESRIARGPVAPLSRHQPSTINHQPLRRLQRKCACGGTPGPSGECAACEQKRLQRKLAVNAPGDKYEQEADRMADLVMSGARATRLALTSSSISGSLQREEKTPPPKDNYEEAKKKIIDALKETPIAKQLKAKAEEMGKDFLGSVEGKVITGSALGGALAGIIASNSELPVAIPELPLDFIAPGLKAKITWEGPTQNPTNAGLTLTTGSGVSISGSYTSTPASPGKPAEQKAGLSLAIPLGGSSTKKKGPSESEKFRSETARLAAEQAKIRESQKTDAERADDKAFLDSYMRSKLNDPMNPLALPGLGRPLAPGPERKKEEEPLLRKASSESASVASAPPIVDEVLQSPGQPLDPGTRLFMEERFGHDFGHVRVHRNDRADASARAVDALAYTVGQDIVFRGDAFAPDSISGRRLLAHELAHVVQQDATPRALQRAPAALEVKGPQTGTGGANARSVFFQRDGSTNRTAASARVPLAPQLQTSAAWSGLACLDGEDSPIPITRYENDLNERTYRLVKRDEAETADLMEFEREGRSVHSAPVRWRANSRSELAHPRPRTNAARAAKSGETWSARNFGSVAVFHDRANMSVRASGADVQRAATLGALAFTERNEIHVPPGLDAPRTPGGRALLAHEIVHAHQWRNAQHTIAPAWPRDHLEAEAHRLGPSIARGEAAAVQGVHRGDEALCHPIFISTHGSQPYLRSAAQFFVRWGYGTPVNVGSIEEMLQNLAAESGSLGKVTLISHAVPENINVAFLRGGPGFVHEQDWAIDTAAELPDFSQHITTQEFLRTTNRNLERDPEARAAMNTLKSGDWLADPIIKQYLWWVVDTVFIRQQEVRPKDRRLRNQLATAAQARVQNYRDVISTARPASRTRFSFADFEAHVDRVTALVEPRSLQEIAHFVKSARNTAVDRVFREIAAGGAHFLKHLAAVRRRMSSSTHIEIQGCRVGRQSDYLTAMSGFFNGAKISAPDWFQGFGMISHEILRRDDDRGFQALWRARRDVQVAFRHWYPIITDKQPIENPSWEDLRDFLRAGHPLMVGRTLLVTAAMAEQTFLAFLVRHKYHINKTSEIRDRFIEKRTLAGAMKFTIIDWLQEQRDPRGPIIFRPDSDYWSHIKWSH